MLTRIQKQRLAREARKLAFECLTNGPEMTDGWCGCAIGVSLTRARLLPTGMSDRHLLGTWLDGLVSGKEEGIYGPLSEATRERMYRGNPTAVVFPLLALADALEESSEQPRAAPSKDF